MSEIDFARLGDFFTLDEIEWRVQMAGEKSGKVWAIVIPYVTNRAIMQRLDDVCGPENWWNDYRPGPGGGVMCGITIRTEHGPVTKWDGADNRSGGDEDMAIKGGLSGAMKRAAVQWQIGRYLYRLDEAFANVHDGGKLRGKTKDGKPFRWDAPQLPAWALPKKAGGRREDPRAANTSEYSSEHEALLLYIKAVGEKVDEELEVEVAGQNRNVRGYIRENWSLMKREYRAALAIAVALEVATGVPLGRGPA